MRGTPTEGGGQGALHGTPTEGSGEKAQGRDQNGATRCDFFSIFGVNFGQFVDVL